MISLTYLSTARTPFTDDDLTDLLGESRPRNHAAGLTGLLLHADGHFIQTLEGPEEAVRGTFDRIGADDRHRSILVALEEEIEQRSYPDWSMGFESLDEEQAARLPGFSSYLADGEVSDADGRELGNADVFHRLFRDTMR